MGDGSSAVWFGAAGFEVLDVVVGDAELVVEVQTTATVIGCERCGTRARAKDRRWVTVRDAPAGDLAGAGALAEADLVLSGAGLCGADLDRTGRSGGAPSGLDRPGRDVGDEPGVGSRGHAGVDRPELRGVVVHGVGGGRTDRRGPGR